MKKQITSWHVGIAAEAFTAAMFARCGYDVSVQYGANQPEYDLMIAKEDKLLKVSVKGSQDGGWGLTQSYLKNADYQKAIEIWLLRHSPKTIFCLVQFENVKLDELPRIYLATPLEIAKVLKGSSNGRGDTILYENYKRGIRASSPGVIEKVPDEWKFSKDRVEEMFQESSVLVVN